MKSYFRVNAERYVPGKCFWIERPSSIDRPKNNSLMFLSSRYAEQAETLSVAFEQVSNCLIFWPEGAEVPEHIQHNHAVVVCQNPHNRFSSFFKENNITNLPLPSPVTVVNGAYIEDGADIGEDCVIFPGAYISKQVVIGDGSYIGAGVKLMGEVTIGKNVVIRENAVIGADGLTTDRDSDGHALTIPQFGGVQIGDNAQIGANTVIARGAIDDTVIESGAKIDNSSFISHNAHVGQDAFIVGETILFGNASVGERTLISGNCLISNRIHVGNNVILGASSTATKDIPDGKIAFGAPATVVRDK